MDPQKKQIVEELFKIMRYLWLNRNDHPLIQRVIAFYDYIILISLPLWSSVELKYHQAPITLVLPQSISFQTILTIILLVHCTAFLVFIVSCVFYIMINFSLAFNKKVLNILLTALLNIIMISSWIYETSFIFTFSLISQTNSFQKILDCSTYASIVSIIASVLYVSIFVDRKIYGKIFPAIFLIRLVLSPSNCSIFTIVASLYLWNTDKRLNHGIIYSQLILLEINEYLMMTQSMPISTDVLFHMCNSSSYEGFVWAILPAIYFLRPIDYTSKQEMPQLNQKIYKILLKMRKDSYDHLQIQEKMMLESYYVKYDDHPVVISWTKGHQNQQILRFFSLSLDRQIQEDSSNISKLILRIRISCFEQKNIMKRLKMLQELNSIAINKSFWVRFDVYCFIDEIITSLNMKHDLNMKSIITNDSVQQKNEKQIHDFILSLTDFWEYLLKDTLFQQIILQKLGFLSEKQMNLLIYLQKFKNSNNLKNSLFIVQFAIKCLNPSYQIVDPNSNEQIASNNKKLVQINYFLLIKNDRIQSISNVLCKRLEYDISLMNGVNRSVLFPSYAVDNLNIIQTSTETDGFFAIPLIDSHGNIHAFKAKVYVKPDLQGNLSYFFVFQQFQNEACHYMIINLKQERINLVSQGFRSCFNHFKDYLISQISLDQLFCNKFSDIMSSSLTDFSVDMKVNQNETKNMKIVRICTYKLNESQYVFLKLEPSRLVTSNTMQKILIENTIVDDGQNKKQDIYKVQKFFCKIPHPFETKYNQHVGRLKDHSRWSVSQKHKRMFIFLLFLVLGIIICLKVIAVLNEQNSLENVSQLKRVNDARNNLIELYLKSYELFYMKNSKLTIGYDKDYSNEILQYETQINTVIHNLQFFRYSYHEEQRPISVHLFFPKFQVSGNSIKTNVVDIIQNAKQFLKTNDIQFLMYNYDFVRAFNQAYDISSTLQDATRNENITIKCLIISTAIIASIMLTVFYLDIFDSVSTARQVIKMIMNSKQKITERKIELLKNFLNFLKENEDIYYVKDPTQTCKRIERNGQLNFLTTQQKRIAAKDEYDLKSIVKKQDNRAKKKQQNTSQNEKFEDENNVFYTLSKKNAILTHPLIAYIRQSYFLCLVAIISVYLFRVLLLYSDFSLQKASILLYYDQFFFTQRNILELQSSVYLLALKKSHNLTDSTQNQNKQIILQLYFQKDLPSYFNQFSTEKLVILNSNLCIRYYQLDGSHTNDQKNISACKGFLGGALSNGLSIAFNQYLVSIQKIKHVISAETSNFFKDNSTLSLLRDIQFMEQVMFLQIAKIGEMFEKQAKFFFQHNANSLIYGMLYEDFLLIVLISLVAYFGIKKYRNKYDLIIKGFLILPKEYVLSHKILKYFRKKQIFDGLSII